MADNFKTLLRFFRIYAKLDLLWFLRDTRYCLLFMCSDLICLLCSMSGIFLLAARFGGLGGMEGQEILFMLGYASITDGIYMLFFMSNNMGQISRIIGRGQLDHSMVQPAPLWIQLLAQGFAPISSCGTLIMGICITAYAVHGLKLSITPLWMLFFILNAAASCLIMMAVIYLISCLAFYAPAAAEEIAQSGIDLFTLKSYPLGGLPKKMQVLFSIFIPIGMGAWFPSKSLLALSSTSVPALHNYTALLPAPVLAAVLILITTIVFQKGMKHYATYGSPRYSGFGHR